MENDGAGQATHKEICEAALEHYEKISLEARCWLSTVPAAIKFYAEYGAALRTERDGLREAAQALVDDWRSTDQFKNGEEWELMNNLEAALAAGQKHTPEQMDRLADAIKHGGTFQPRPSREEG